MGSRRSRQLFLFLAVLSLPAVMIAVQGRRLSIQEQQLATARQEEIRKRTAAEIGQEIATRLERIRVQEMANTPPTPQRAHRTADSAVAVAGWIDGGRIVWPWDVSSGPSSPEPNREFTQTFDQARRAEFAEQRVDRAADLYRQAAAIAGAETVRAAARLGLARTRLRAGQRAAALEAYRAVFDLPSSVTDDHGLSYWSSAAVPLVDLGAGPEILERVSADLESPVAWPPVQMYRFRTILEALQRSQGAAVDRDTRLAVERLELRLREVERAKHLQKDFPTLSISATSWLAYKGEDLWLVGRSPVGATPTPLILAVRWAVVRRALETDRPSRPQFEIAATGAGDHLNEYLPDLRITFPQGVPEAAAAISSQRSLWRFSLALAAPLTILGGLLLWRDMRREAHLAELRTQFVSSVTHELKTPLTSIRMFAELLQMKGSVDPDHSRFLGTIVSESERLTRLLNNVLDFSRIERGQKTYRLEPAPLADVVQSAVRTIQYPLMQQGFVLDLEVRDNVPPVAVDRDAVQQAILNLLTNAMRYSGEHREIRLSLSAENGSALIQVSDRGIGIPEEEQSRIFDKFYRVPVPANREISGTGLGLSLVAHIAEAHGGSVRVKSRPGEGSTFSILLPLKAGGAV
jgi:signal transduction histidine kinase